jgi:amphi-Trp domain-containing protein
MVENENMAKDNQFEFESLENTDTLQRYLQSLIDGFRSGRITLNSDRDCIVLNPNGLIQFQVKVEKKSRQNKLSLKMSWKETSQDSVGGNNIKIIA